MTYIDLVNRFWQMDLEFRFSHLEVHLYFKILDLFNRSGWRKILSVPNSRFVAELGATEPSVIRARQRLVDSGLLSYSKGNQRKAGKYMLLYYKKEGINDSTSGVEEESYYQKRGTNYGISDSISDSINDSINDSANVSLYKNRQEETREEKTLSSNSLDEKDSKELEEHNVICDPEKVLPPKPKANPTPYQDIYEMFLSICSSLPRIQEPKDWAKSRRDCVASRWREHPDIGFFHDLFHRIKDSDFLSGRANTFKAGFDWIFKPANLQKILEGNYDNRVSRDNSAQKFAGLAQFRVEET